MRASAWGCVLLLCLGDGEGRCLLWPAVSPRGPGSSWKTGLTCPSLSVSGHGGCSQKMPGERCNQNPPCFPAVLAPMALHVPSNPTMPLGLGTQLPFTLPRTEARTFSGSSFHIVMKSFSLLFTLSARRNYSGLRSI